jgi:multicomponent Na+:H+ antiporter subunit E
MSDQVRKILLLARRLAVLGLIWFGLVGNDPASILPGMIAVAAAGWISVRLLPLRANIRVWRFVLLLPSFFWRSVLGAVDVASRAFDPRMPLRPGWLEVPSRLPPGGRAALGGAFSLMPGTLVAGTRKGCLLVHCLDTRQPVEEAVQAEEQAFADGLVPPEGSVP